MRQGLVQVLHVMCLKLPLQQSMWVSWITDAPCAAQSTAEIDTQLWIQCFAACDATVTQQYACRQEWSDIGLLWFVTMYEPNQAMQT